MPVQRLDHVTVRCTPGQLPAVVAFYRDAVGLEDGWRPPFRSKGAWLYLAGRPVLHVLATAPEDSAQPPSPGPLDHVAFAASDLDATRARLAAAGVPFEEVPLSGTRLLQLFLRDPAGAIVEINVEMPEVYGPGGPHPRVPGS